MSKITGSVVRSHSSKARVCLKATNHASPKLAVTFASPPKSVSEIQKDKNQFYSFIIARLVPKGKRTYRPLRA